MIRRISSTDPRFRSLTLQPGLNLVVARRSARATARDSTNALGKSSLLRVLHFGLGAKPRRGRDVPNLAALDGWTFTYDLVLGECEVQVTRAVGSSDVHLSGAPASWGEPAGDGQIRLTATQWTNRLGVEWFRLRPDDGNPSTRQLLSYVARYEKKHFTDPFQILEGASAASMSAAAWLLGLPATLPQEKRRLEQRLAEIKPFKEAKHRVAFLGISTSRPVLEAERARILERISELERERGRYELRQQSLAVRERADQLTSAFNRLRDDRAADEEVLAHYRRAIADLAPTVSSRAVEALYNEAGIWLPEKIVRRIDEVQAFHQNLMENRRSFLAKEIGTLTRRSAERAHEMAAIDAQRAPLLAVLAEDRAVDAYLKLGAEIAELRATEAGIHAQVEVLRASVVEERRIQDEQHDLVRRAVLIHEEYADTRDHAQRLFSGFVRETFHEEGRLVIDLSSPAYRFDCQIPSIESGGVGRLAIACLDLTVARLLHERGVGPGLLVHDSHTFDGMDARQLAGTLKSAWQESSTLGYTYLALLNEDQLERARPELPMRGFEDYVRLHLTDHEVDGGLFGFRFGR